MLQRWDPISELRRMEDTMNRLWRGVADAEPFQDGDTGTWMFPVDVVEEKDRILVKASLPGIAPERVDVSIEDGVLAIKGDLKEEREQKDANYLLRERRAGSFYRAIRLPDSADPDKAQSTYEHGVLTVSLPKVEAKRPKQIKVHVSGPALEGKKA
ncbi:MAG: Hsp20/alpha crystallin family protein [Chloroflexi bacterium]|nr:Hsp20/alpha crystallin family protein [Chloroflexota bacterium]